MNVVCGIVIVGRQPFAHLILSREHDDDSSARLIASVLGCYLTTTRQPLKAYHRKLQRYDTQTPTHFHAWDLLRAFTQSHASELHFTTPVTQQPSLSVTALFYDQRACWLHLEHTSRYLRRARNFPTGPLTSTRSDWISDSLTSDIMARGKRTSRLQDALPPAPEPDSNAAAGEAATPDEHESMLDPSTSERRYWRDPLTAVQREIWRPGMFISRTHHLSSC